MVMFTPVDPADINTDRLGRRGRVSYPLLKAFLEASDPKTGKPLKMGKLNADDYKKNPAYLRSVLTSYIKSHHLPVKLFAAQGDMYLMRLDLDNNGDPIPDWKPEMQATEGSKGLLRDMEPTPLNANEVANRFAESKDDLTR